MAQRLRLEALKGWPAAAQRPWVALALGLMLMSGLTWLLLGATSASPPPTPEGADRWVWTAAHRHAPGAALRWWTAAGVHHSGWHLLANLGAALAVAAWGVAARVKWPEALAWLLAWPLSQALLFTDPGTLWRYAGLSATLHAGVVIGCLHLLHQGAGGRRAVGAAVLLALLIKLTLEVPLLQTLWTGTVAGALPAPPLPGAPGHVVAGQAHGCGTLAGALAWMLVHGMIKLVR